MELPDRVIEDLESIRNGKIYAERPMEILCVRPKGLIPKSVKQTKAFQLRWKGIERNGCEVWHLHYAPLY
jgi:hypothetical protein